MARSLLTFFLLSQVAMAGEQFPCGLLGARADAVAGERSVTIVALEAGGAAEAAGLLVGDRIWAIDGTEFPPHSGSVDGGGDGPQRVLGERADAVAGRAALRQQKKERDDTATVLAADANPPTVVLTVERDGDREDITVTLQPRLPLAGDHRALGRQALRDAAAAQLIRSIDGGGYWNSPVGLSGDRVITAWAVIALLAHGDPAHAEPIARAVRWLRGPEGRSWVPVDYSKGPDNLGNWALTSTIAALAEHQLAYPDADHRAVIDHLCKGLVARMTEEGRFGHDVTVGYGGKGFNVINTLAHFAWALAEEARVEVDEKAWKLSLDQIRASIDPDGGVRYWTMKGTGTGDASLRTGSMALALQLRGEERELCGRLVQYLDEYNKRTREAHAVGSLGMLVAAPALRADDPRRWERFLEEWRWYLSLCWGEDGRIRYIGGKGNNGGDSYLGFDDVACVIALQLLACEDGRLRMHGQPR